MGANITIRKFENGLINYINASALPMEVKSLVLQAVLQQVKEQANSLILEEKEEENENGDV